MDSGPFGEPTGKADLTGYPAKALWVEDKGREIRTPHLVVAGGKESPNPEEVRDSRTLRQMSLLAFCCFLPF